MCALKNMVIVLALSCFLGSCGKKTKYDGAWNDYYNSCKIGAEKSYKALYKQMNVNVRPSKFGKKKFEVACDCETRGFATILASDEIKMMTAYRKELAASEAAQMLDVKNRSEQLKTLHSRGLKESISRVEKTCLNFYKSLRPFEEIPPLPF